MYDTYPPYLEWRLIQPENTYLNVSEPHQMGKYMAVTHLFVSILAIWTGGVAKKKLTLLVSTSLQSYCMSKATVSEEYISSLMSFSSSELASSESESDSWATTSGSQPAS